MILFVGKDAVNQDQKGHEEGEWGEKEPKVHLTT